MIKALDHNREPKLGAFLTEELYGDE